MEGVVSSYYILQRIQANHTVNDSSWFNDAIDWIGQAMRFIGKHAGFDTKICPDIYVENYKCCYPIGMEGLIAILYNGILLPLGSDISGMGYDRKATASMLTKVSNNEYITELNGLQSQQEELVALYAQSPTQVIADKINDVSLKISNIEKYVSGVNQSMNVQRTKSGEYYNTKHNFIETSFPTGYIDVIYTSFLIDEKGFPMILDDEYYIQAIEWYIILILIQKGYQHPLFTYHDAYDMFWGNKNKGIIGWRNKASNHVQIPSLQEVERFTRMWTQFKVRRELPQMLFSKTEQTMGTLY